MGIYSYNGTELTPIGAGGHTIKNSDGTSFPNRKNLVFDNALITDDSTNDATIVSTGGSSVSLADVSGATATTFGTTASLTWSDPQDVILEDIPLATWSGTKIIRKVGSAPTSKTDGVTILDSKIRNAYSSAAYEDTNLTYGTTYYYRFYPYTTDGRYTEGTALAVTPARQAIAVTPTISEELTYDGTQQTITIDNFDSTKMTVTGNTGTNAGSYTASVTPKEGYCWNDLSYGTISLPWTIEKYTIAIPTTTTGFVYDGTSHESITSAYDPDEITVTGTHTATEVGAYTYIMALADPLNYMWTDETSTAKEITWRIAAELVPIPTVTSTLVYDGTSQSPTIGSYDSTKVTLVSGDSGTNAGTYNVIFSLVDPTDYTWSDGTVADQSVPWTIAKAKLSAPTVSSNLVYNGLQQTATVSSYDSTKISVTGITGTNADTYTATIALIDDDNYWWTDETTADKTASWAIAQAAATATLSKNSVELDTTTTSDTVTISNATGTVGTPTSGDTTVATVTISGSTITITAVDSGTTSITVPIGASVDGNYTAGSVSITVEVSFGGSIYGVEWDGTSTSTWTRTDDAASFTNPSPAVNNGNGSSPFDSILPWSGMKRVTDSAAGTLVEIPKYYYKWTRTGTKMKLQISDSSFDGSHVSPAHADRGDGKGERDVVYVGAYHCATSTYKSTTGVKPMGNVTRADFRTNIHSLGSTIWQYDYAMFWTINMLYLVEYADWNSQEKIGYGCGNNSSTENAGLCDAMTYHTGTNAANRTTYGHTRYRYIEDLWGNIFDWCDGIYFSSSNVYCIKNPANFSDTSGGTLVGTRATESNCIKSWTTPSATGFEYALYPATVVSDSNYATYVCDQCDYNASGVVLCVGGYYNQGQGRGAFYLNGSNAASSKVASRGSRLQKLP